MVKVLSGMFLELILICFSSVAVASEKLQTEITKEDLPKKLGLKPRPFRTAFL
ncbi:MAG: hypothetical protein HC815_21270 [Richelia sp. RM1_1_1]|nr:hypothetical protein [Richelia sp. RM1_1_1]